MASGDTAIVAWLDQLSARSPTPGGGAVAALCAAVSAGLVGMVTAYTTGPKWVDREARMHELNDEAAHLRTTALGVTDDDVDAFGAVAAAYALRADSLEEKAARTATIQQALVGAAAPPEHAGRIAARLIEIAEELVDSSNPNVLSDVAVASATARAALDAAIVNIDVNRRAIRDDEEAARLDSVVKELGLAAERADRVTAAVRERMR